MLPHHFTDEETEAQKFSRLESRDSPGSVLCPRAASLCPGSERKGLVCLTSVWIWGAEGRETGALCEAKGAKGRQPQAQNSWALIPPPSALVRAGAAFLPSRRSLPQERKVQAGKVRLHLGKIPRACLSPAQCEETEAQSRK